MPTQKDHLAYKKNLGRLDLDRQQVQNQNITQVNTESFAILDILEYK